MAKTGLLIITNPSKFGRFIPKLREEIKNTLYVHLYPPKTPPISPKFNQSLIYGTSVINLYKNALGLRPVDVQVLLAPLRDPHLNGIATKSPIEVVFLDDSLNHEEMKHFINSSILNKTTDCQTVPLSFTSDDSVANNLPDASEMYNNVVLGGTFDRLHIGHKILLSEAVLRCQKKLTVGVTDVNMLKSKKLWELIEPCTLRITKVRNFLEDVEPNLEYSIVPIDDMYGPTKDDPTFELLIVSAETLGGGEKVNQVRQKNGLKPLKVHSVDLVPDEKEDDEEEDKVSSSNLRLRALGTLIYPPLAKPHLPKLPYLIGLTGGIASGKSALSERLKNLGAAVIDCDKVAHSLYTKGSSHYKKIVEIFGSDILNENGDINRRKLGEIVFNNKEKLQTLNDLLWPGILERSKEMALERYRQGLKVVILEAAVLIQAGWENFLHEVWASIIPPDEAVRRLQNRNHLSEKKAISRIATQPTNSEFVAKSNVVFCTLWRPEFSQKQVERAWTSLQERLPC